MPILTVTVAPATATAATDSALDESEHADKRQRIDLCDFEDEVNAAVSANVDEVDTYLQTRITSDGEWDLLAWWKEQAKANSFPKLTVLARQLFAIPACSAASERCGLYRHRTPDDADNRYCR